MAELNYDFKKRLNTVHKKDRRAEKPLGENQIEVTSDWNVIAPADDSFLQDVGRDLQDYFATSMNVEVGYSLLPRARYTITYVIDPTLKGEGSYCVEVKKTKIRLIGKTARAAAQASYLLEDLMNLEEAPYVALGRERRKPIFRCRMIHSGLGEDDYSDAHLNAIAHAGINTILLFVRDVNRASTRTLDFNDLIARAARYGLDTYAYSYMRSRLHPDAEGAEEYYDSLYGNLFRKCPGFKGVVFVGESIGFESRDPRTSGLMRHVSVYPDGTKATKPNPSNFPCNDYPDWINLIKRIIRRERPDADLVFWSYNWGNKAEDLRVELIDHMPKDISWQATFEMFEDLTVEGVPARTSDYSLFFTGPGKYFLSEAKAAGRNGIPLYAMTNAAGLTWDVGTVPFEPCPDQWLRRYEHMRECHDQYGLIGSMDSHHYGFYPSFISDLAKAYFTEEQPNGEAILNRLVARDWGKENLKSARKGLSLFSEAVQYVLSTDSDQYGPMRIGPSYPFLLFNDHKLVIPFTPGAHFGNNYICKPNYSYPLHREGKKETITGEIRLLKKAYDLFLQGADLLRALLPDVAAHKRDDAQRIIGIGEFMGRTCYTTHLVKRWYLCKQALMAEGADFAPILAELREIAALEIENVKATIPLAAFDSRLGFEPSLEYYCDVAHLEWKLGMMNKMLTEDIPELEREGRVKHTTPMDYPRGVWENMTDPD